MLPLIIIIALSLSRVCVAQWEVAQAWSDNSTVAPTTSNSLQMKGLNFSTLTGNTLAIPQSSEIWDLHVNYSIGPIDIWGGGRPIPLYSYTLSFPETELPTINQSNWRLCAHILQFPLPDNITNLALPANATAGDCSPYLGDECVQDYVSMLASSPLSGYCPTPLLFLNIPSCQARIGNQPRQAIVSRVISDWTVSGISLLRNGTFVNTTSGEVAEGEIVHGLRSGQIFSKQGPSDAATENATLRNEQANMLQFMAFTQTPSQYWLQNQTNGVADGIYSEVRLVCGNTNRTFEGTLKSPGSNAANSIMGFVTLKAALLAFALSLYAVSV